MLSDLRKNVDTLVYCRVVDAVDWRVARARMEFDSRFTVHSRIFNVYMLGWLTAEETLYQVLSVEVDGAAS